MQLIASLAGGMVGAEGGTARIYVLGTSTRATVYADYQGTSVDSSGADIALDGNGRAIVYANQLVGVEVCSATGAQLTSFVSGDGASSVEYQGQSFTGTNRQTGASGAGSGYAVMLQAILDRWKTSSGSIDFNVLLGGVATSLQTAFGAVGGLVFNVKDPTYGAIGNGVADDTAAVAAAIAAADLTYGGVVFFPPGSYRITSALTVPISVSLRGSGASATWLVVDAVATALAVAGSSGVAPEEISGISFWSGQSNTSALVTVADGARRVFRECYFGQIGGGTNDLGANVSVAASTTSEVHFDRCHFRISTTATASMLTSASSAVISASACTFRCPASYTPTNGIVYGNSLWLDGCVFNHVPCTTGTIASVKFNTTTVVGNISRCNFTTDGGSAAITAMTLGTYATGSRFSEADNIFGTDVTAYSYTYAFASAGAQVMLGTRAKRHKTVVSTSATPALETDQYGMITLDITVASNVVMSVVTPPAGNGGTIFMDNHNGTARIYSILPGAGSVDPASGAIDASNQNTMIYSIMETGTAAFWACNWSYTP